MIGWVKHATILLTLATLCGCASGKSWMQSGNTRFSAQLQAFQRGDYSSSGPSATITQVAAKLKGEQIASAAAAKETAADAVVTATETEQSADVVIAADEVEQPGKAAVVLTSNDTPEETPVAEETTVVEEPPFTEFEGTIVAGKPAAEVPTAATTAEPAPAAAADDSPSDEELELIAALRHPDAGLRALAAWRLGRLSDPSDEVLFSLRTVAADEQNGLVRVRIAEAASKLDPQDAAAVQWLIEALDEGDWQVRWLAAGTLDVAHQGAAATEAVWKLSTVLTTDEHPKVRQIAALTLGSFGTEATAVLPHLREALADEAAEVREAAETALACIAAAQK